MPPLHDLHVAASHPPVLEEALSCSHSVQLAAASGVEGDQGGQGVQAAAAIPTAAVVK